MSTSRYNRPRRAVRPRLGFAKQRTFERLEDRALLAAGPYLHVHNTDTLAVVDASSGELEVVHRMTGFQGDELRLSDIAFSPAGRLYGIAQGWLYEINPVNGSLTTLGPHNISGVTSLVFNPAGALQAMGRDDGSLYQWTNIDAPLPLPEPIKVATLSNVKGQAIQGSNGDITYNNGKLIVATNDDLLITYEFPIGPNRPQPSSQIDLTDMDIIGVFGLASVDGHLYATAGTSVYEINNWDSQLPPSATKVALQNTSFGSLRGAAYYAEAGETVPIGTLSGIKWFDRNRDGVYQNNEPVLPDWPVYIDVNLSGAYEVGEPLRRTDDKGRFYFFGREPGLYTIDEIIVDTEAWEQTYPQTPNRNVVGIYDFEDGRGTNQLDHDFGLPDLISSLVTISGGAAKYNGVSSYLELPWALGDTPFTIVLDASYETVFGSPQYLVSQMAGADDADRDFQMRAEPTSRKVTSSFCNQQGVCSGRELGAIDGDFHRYAITWDGRSLGAFYDGVLLKQTVSGTLPDIDGQVVRFGNPDSLPTAAGLRGVIKEIRIFNQALTQSELITAMSTEVAPNAYSILLNDQTGIDDLNFGNAEPTVVVLAPEIAVARDAVEGAQVANGDTMDLGISSSTGTPPHAELWISNLGTQTLELSNVTVSSGFQFDVMPMSSLEPGESTSLSLSVSDLTQGFKTGHVSLVNNDQDKNPFVVHLTAEILNPDERPRHILINSSTGNILSVDPATGARRTVLSGGRAMTDIAYNSQTDRLYGIDAGFLYEINLATTTVTQLFAHNVTSARALGFAPNGQLFAAGQDVYQLDVNERTSVKYANGGTALAGDIAFLGNRMFMSTAAGDLYEVDSDGATRLGSLSGVTMNGLVATDASTLYGFANNSGYLINVNDLTLTPQPQFGVLVFTVAGATFQPHVRVHNDVDALDVNDDGSITPTDVLLVINELNSPKFTDNTGRIIGVPTAPTRYPDTNDDGFITPADVILVVNHLNSLPTTLRVAATAATDAVLGSPLDAEAESTGVPHSWLDDFANDIAMALEGMNSLHGKRTT